MAEGSKTHCEYRRDAAVIHIGKTEEERLEGLTSCAEEAAKKEEVKSVVLDYEAVDVMLYRDASQIIVVRDIFSPRDVYICNAGANNHKVLDRLGITKLPGIYLRGTVEETLDELANWKQEQIQTYKN